MPNSSLKLPYLFEVNKLQQDLETCLASYWQEHFNERDYNGKWTSISLRSLSGREDDIHSHPGQYSDTPLLAACPYFSQIASMFHCVKESIRLLSLGAGSTIKEHTDLNAGYQYGFFRIHIPIRTDGHVAFHVDGKNIPMGAGECWYADFSLPHSVHNSGLQDRVHLVMDCQRNEWSDSLFVQCGYDFEEEKHMKTIDAATREKMLAELEFMGTETARALIERLKEEQDNFGH